VTQVGGMPTATGKTDWPAIVATLRENPNVPILFEEFKDTPRLRSLMTTINQRLTPLLRELPGEVRANMRGSHLVDGKLHGDLWVTWIPRNDAP